VPDAVAEAGDREESDMVDDATIEQLKQEAVRASRYAYCRYSGFPVGAAVLTGDGAIFSGSNVENASYSLTICAERNAVFQAVAKGARQIVAVVVYTPTAEPTAPCGACRQVIHEFGPEADVICVCDTDKVLRRSAGDLLPDAFGPDNLNGAA
jgi:cytidine deaminase